MKRLFVCMTASAFAAALQGQQLDNPVSLPVHFYGEGIVTTGGQPYSEYIITGLGPGAYVSGSYLPGGATVYSSLVTANVIPGKDYTLQVTSSNFTVVNVNFAAIPGYEFYMGPTAASTRTNKFTLGANYTFHFRLEAINDLTSSLADKRGGECSSLTEDKAICYIGLGRLRGGRYAGAVGFRDSYSSTHPCTKPPR